MSNTDSSAIVRLIQIAQQEPILETERPPVDTVPTELIAPNDLEEVEPHRSSWRRYALTGAIMVGLGVGAAFYLADHGGSAAATARGGLPGMESRQPAASALAMPAETSEPTPAVAPIAEPAAVEAVPEVAVATPIEPAVATPVEAAPAVAAPVAAPIAPVAEPAPAAVEAPAAADTPAEPAVAEKAPEKAKKSKKSKRSRHHRSAKRHSKSRARTAAASSGATGTLLVGSKPPCKIYIDGHYTGMKTPQRAIKLSEGKHRLELRNAEHGIKSRATVVIKAGKSTKVIKDLSDRL